MFFLQTAAAFAAGLLIAAASGAAALRADRCRVQPVPAERINPNTAPAASMMRLPGIGRVRAMDIVADRVGRDDGAAFQAAADLARIRGIGPKTVEKIAPYLVFDNADSTP